jgi:hypothetical protein
VKQYRSELYKQPPNEGEAFVRQVAIVTNRAVGRRRPGCGPLGRRVARAAHARPNASQAGRVCWLCVRHTEGRQGTQRALQGRRGAATEGTQGPATRRKLRLGAMYVDSNLVFTKEEGGILPPWKVWQHFVRLLQLSGLPRFPYHALRYTAATLMLENSEHPKGGAGDARSRKHLTDSGHLLSCNSETCSPKPPSGSIRCYFERVGVGLVSKSSQGETCACKLPAKCTLRITARRSPCRTRI